MKAARRAIRPKHQVLILKCYPKFQKLNVEVKPNSSELSYLLYYASTRRSKLQKVGAFLEKRTVSDVGRNRIGNVQVTLQIVTALIEKCPRDLPLYAHSVLNVLGTILKSNDVTMVEDSVATFESFCNHQDPATLAADQAYGRHYEDIVRFYAIFAEKDTPGRTKAPSSIPVAIRYRSAGLRAIRGITASESLSLDPRGQLELIMPAILQNLYSREGKYLLSLQERERLRQQTQREEAMRRRTSLATVRTLDTSTEGDPVAASGTTADADKLEEEEVGILALQCLRNIFNVNNRGQLRLATSIVLKFIGAQVKPKEHFRPGSGWNSHKGSWPTTLLEILSRWAPVQDRFLILVTAMDTLVRSPIVEEDMERQLVLAVIIDRLLSSDLNLIGLSVMDVLIGLVQHTLLLLQLGGKGTNVRPHPQQADALPGIDRESEKSFGEAPSTGQLTASVVMEVVEKASTWRRQLLDQIQQCIGDLATHIYYSDQIADMVSAILLRLKPSMVSIVPTTASAIEDPVGAIDAIADSVHLHENPNTDGFFSFDTARLTALAAVKRILTVANFNKANGHGAIGRNRVSVTVWEGTQWLLRDPNGQVRKVYIDTLLTWLHLELEKKDLRILEERLRPSKRVLPEGAESTAKTLARRAMSNASQRENASKRAKSTYVQLLHLAVYEHALSCAESEPDILLLHLLLTTLVEKLGVNAVRFGLPMIFRLQEDIQYVENPLAKVRIGSLVHEYLWAICESFDLDTSRPGQEILAEVTRRKQTGLWTENVRLPPLPLKDIPSPSERRYEEKLPLHVVQSAFLKPFDGRQQLVEGIAEAYTLSIGEPPASPPASPGRSFSLPAFSWSGSIAPPPDKFSQSNNLPANVREQMLSDWSREACIAAVELEQNKTSSINGSKAGTGSAIRTLQHPNTWPNGHASGSEDATDCPQYPADRGSGAARAYGLMSLGPLDNNHRAMLRRLSGTGGSPQRSGNSSSSQRPNLRVEDLKRVLAGDVPAATTFPIHSRYDDDNASDSMVSADGLTSEMSYSAGPPAQEAIGAYDFAHSGFSRPEGGSKAMASYAIRARKESLQDERDIPPVPPLPPGLTASSSAVDLGTLQQRVSSAQGQLHAHPQSADGPRRAVSPNSRRSVPSSFVSTNRGPNPTAGGPRRGNMERGPSTWSVYSRKSMVVDELLGGIDFEKREVGKGSLRGRAPY